MKLLFGLCFIYLTSQFSPIVNAQEKLEEGRLTRHEYLVHLFYCVNVLGLIEHDPTKQKEVLTLRADRLKQGELQSGIYVFTPRYAHFIPDPVSSKFPPGKDIWLSLTGENRPLIIINLQNTDKMKWRVGSKKPNAPVPASFSMSELSPGDSQATGALADELVKEINRTETRWTAELTSARYTQLEKCRANGTGIVKSVGTALNQQIKVLEKKLTELKTVPEVNGTLTESPADPKAASAME